MQCCPLCMSSVACCPLCVLHAAGWNDAACCRLKQHVATLHAVGSACCMLQCRFSLQVACRPLQCCPLCMMSVACCPLCVLHVVGWSNAACYRMKQHVAMLHVVGSACCMLQCCPLQPILLSVASGILNPVSSARCNADGCMLHFRYVLSFPHVAMLPVACCNVDRYMLQRCPLHLVFSSTRRD